MKTSKRIEQGPRGLGAIKEIHTTEFYSLSEFYTYIKHTETNSVFSKSSELHSQTGSLNFTGTESFEEAVELMKNGWSVKAKELEQRLKTSNIRLKNETKKRTVYDVVGFQPSVPRYLQGIPTSMINKKNVVQKKKVITLNKNISYHARITTQEILDNSVKALQIIQKIEAQGIRCNLNLICCIRDRSTTEINILKIRLKSANERLNVSKLAFPLVHPSMLRRLVFRFIEVSPTFTKNSYTSGYGYPMKDDDNIEKTYYEIKDEHFLSRFIDDIDKEIERILK